jgi:hypothetical protein
MQDTGCNAPNLPSTALPLPPVMAPLLMTGIWMLLGGAAGIKLAQSMWRLLGWGAGTCPSPFRSGGGGWGARRGDGLMVIIPFEGG